MSAVAVQTAIYAALVAGMTCPVYDDVPQDAAYPYLTIDQLAAIEEDDFIEHLLQWQVTLSVWSEYRGKKEAAELLEQARTAIHNKRLPGGAAFVETVVSRMSLNRDQDGRTYTGQMTVDVLYHYP